MNGNFYNKKSFLKGNARKGQKEARKEGVGLKKNNYGWRDGRILPQTLPLYASFF